MQKDARRFVRRFGKSLRASRRAVRLTQEEASERAGITAKYLSRIERGDQTPSVYLAWQLAKAVHTDLSSLADAAVNDARSDEVAIRHLVAKLPSEMLRRVRLALQILFQED